MPSIAQVEPLTSARALRGPFDYRLPEELRGGAVDVGSMLVVPFGRREVLGVVVGLSERSEVAEEKLLAPLRALASSACRSSWSRSPSGSRPSTARRSRARLRSCCRPGATRRLERAQTPHCRRPRAPAGRRSPATAAAADARSRRRRYESAPGRARGGSASSGPLLHGVTGSGKTEVYLRAAADALEQGRGAIVLVPEIALTPQIVGRFFERFGDTVAVLHSRLRGAERYEEWRRLRTGEARVCVGPRSAVFAPIEDLGLIVVDEEHDASYKHEGDPRYDAREVAVQRASAAGALLLLGSATPRPESIARLRRAAPVRAASTAAPLPQVRCSTCAVSREPGCTR